MMRADAIARLDPDRSDGRPRRSAPLLPAAVGMTLGVAVDNAMAPPMIVYACLLLVALVGLFLPGLRRGHPGVIALVTAACVGGIRHDGFYRRVAPDHVVHFVTDEPALVRISGTVLSSPRRHEPRTHFFGRWTYRYRRTRLLLKASSIEGRGGPIPVSGLVAVAVDGEVVDVEAGDEVAAYGTAYRPWGPSNPGQFDYARWQRRQGVRVGMRCRGADLVVVRTKAADPVRAAVGRFRQLARRALLEDELVFADEQRGLIETVVLGRRDAVDAETEKRFIRTGAAHFLAVSGVHVGVVAWLAWALMRSTGRTRRESALVVIAVIVAFAGLVDPRPSVFRAAIIGVLYCVGLMLRRSAHGLNSTALALIVLLCIRPAMLFSPGFQMSFAGVVSIICLHEPLLRLWRRFIEGQHPEDDLIRVEPRDRGVAGLVFRRLYHSVRSVGAVSVAAWIATAPIAWFHFGRVAPLGWLNSVLLFPFFAATLVLGVITTLVGIVLPSIAVWLKAATAASVDVLLRAVGVLEAVSPAAQGWGGGMTRAGCIAILLLLLIGGRAMSVGGWRGWNVGRVLTAASGWRWFSGGLVALAVVVMPLAAARYGGQSRGVRVTWLAVGRGNATMIEWSDGRVWLYDCGSSSAYDVGENVVLPFCRHRGIRRIDRIVISHPKVDHFSGLMSIIEGLSCGPVTINRHFERVAPPDGPARMMMIELGRRGHPVELVDGGLSGPVGGRASFEVLWPPDELPNGVAMQDTSTVARVRYLGRSVLLTGDIEAYAIRELVAGEDLVADVLALPNHGRVGQDTADLIASVDPRLCVRSSNQRGDRTSHAFVDALGGRTCMNTAEDGAVSLVIDESGLTVGGYRRGPVTRY